jgi:hypothetical protein
MINTVEEAIGQLRHIQLDSQHSPHDIVHMILGGGLSQSVFNISTGVHQRAVEFLCKETGNIRDYPVDSGIIHEDAKGRPYFVKGTESFAVDSRPNEILAMLTVAGVHLESTSAITNRGRERMLADLAETAQQKFRISLEEPGWSLMLFSTYPGPTKEWTNDDGEICSVEKILRNAIARQFGDGACMGTHVIEGVAHAVSKFCLEEDVEPSMLEGTWKDAHEYLSKAIRLIEMNQKEDGSIDRRWYGERKIPHGKKEWKEKAKDVFSRRYHPAKAIVYPTGHCLDALSPLGMFLAPEREWMYRACYVTAKMIQDEWIPLASEIPALSHAVHALKILGD